MSDKDEDPVNDPGAEDQGLEPRLRRLDEIVAALEADDLDLERALALFEEGVGHVRKAEGILAQTELRVAELLGDGEEAQIRPFEDNSEA